MKTFASSILRIDCDLWMTNGNATKLTFFFHIEKNKYFSTNYSHQCDNFSTDHTLNSRQTNNKSNNRINSKWFFFLSLLFTSFSLYCGCIFLNDFFLFFVSIWINYFSMEKKELKRFSWFSFLFMKIYVNNWTL